LRQYAAEKLVEAGETESVRQRHADYYLELSEQFWDGSLRPTRPELMHDVATENDNFRAALDWCLAAGHARTGLAIACMLACYCEFSANYRESQYWLVHLLAATPEPTRERASGLTLLAVVAARQGDYVLAVSASEESLALSKALGNRFDIANSSFVLAMSLELSGDFARKRSLYERGLALYQELDKQLMAAAAMQNLGELARTEGDLARARELDEQAVALERSIGGKGSSFAWNSLGMVLIHFGELDRSQELLQEHLLAQLGAGGGAWLSIDLMAFAFLANARGHPLRAIRLLAASETLRKSGGLVLQHGDLPDYESNLASLRVQLGPAAFEAAWAEGEALTEEQTVALALSDEP
jgi:non-specific serine/threonine protein kinase